MWLYIGTSFDPVLNFNTEKLLQPLLGHKIIAAQYTDTEIPIAHLDTP